MSFAVYQTNGQCPAPHVIYLTSRDAIEYPTTRQEYNPDSGVVEQKNERLRTDCIWSMSIALSQYRHFDAVISLQNVQIPRTYYDFVGGYNDQLYCVFVNLANDIHIDFTITVPPGNYEPDSVASTLQPLLGAAMTTAAAAAQLAPFTSDPTVVYDKPSNKLTFGFGATQTPGIRVEFMHQPNAPGDFPRALTRELGFMDTENAYIQLSAGGAFDSFPPAVGSKMFTPFVLDLTAGMHTIMVRTNLTPTSVLASNTDLLGVKSVTYSSILAAVSCSNTPPGSIITLDRMGQPARVHSQQVSLIRAQLTQDDNRLIDLMGHDWSMTLAVSYTPRGDPVPPPISEPAKTDNTASNKKRPANQTQNNNTPASST